MSFTPNEMFVVHTDVVTIDDDGHVTVFPIAVSNLPVMENDLEYEREDEETDEGQNVFHDHSPLQSSSSLRR
jgi:hypothetical protein